MVGPVDDLTAAVILREYLELLVSQIGLKIHAAEGGARQPSDDLYALDGACRDRRRVFGDLMSCFGFRNPNGAGPRWCPRPRARRPIPPTRSEGGIAGRAGPPRARCPRRRWRCTPLARAALPPAHQRQRRPGGPPRVWLSFSNTGTQARCSTSTTNSTHALSTALHRRGRQDDLRTPAGQHRRAGRYSLWVLGPNGYHRRFAGPARRALAGAANPGARVLTPKRNAVRLTIMNMGEAPAAVTVRANAYRGDGPWTCPPCRLASSSSPRGASPTSTAGTTSR